VVGVAKTSFTGSAFAEPVLRGGSARPHSVTAAGAAARAAAGWIRSMHGAHRIPTLLKRADRLCRDAMG
jgi:deoxyribonuclease V